SRSSSRARRPAGARGTGCSKPCASTPMSCSWSAASSLPSASANLRHFSALAASTEVCWPPFVTETFLSEHREDYESVRAALEWAAESDPCAGLALFAATRELFQMLGQADGRRIAQLLLERCPDRDRPRVDVLITAGILAMVTANADAARAFQ